MPIAPQWPPKWPPVGWECVPRTTSERIPTQRPETSAEAHTELARAEFPVIGGAAMTRRRRLQYKHKQPLPLSALPPLSVRTKRD